MRATPTRRRSSSLASSHPAAPPAEAAPKAAAEPPVETTTPPPAATTPAKSKPKRSKPAAATRETDSGDDSAARQPAPGSRPGGVPRSPQGARPQSKVVHVAEELVNRWRLRATTDRVPITTVAFRAIEDAYQELAALFPEQPVQSSMFESQARHRERPHLRREQVTLRLTPANEALIDGIAAEHGVSRSDLVETTVARYLGVDLKTLESR